MGSKVGKILKTAAPVIIGAATGNPYLAMAAGAGLGATDGGLKGALAGGLSGYAGAGGGGLLGSGVSKAAGLGLSTAQSSALGTGLLGAASGGLSGGLKGALAGGLAGGAGGYAMGGGLDGLGSDISNSLGLDGTSVGNFLGGNQNAGYSPGEITSGPIGSTGTVTGGGSSAFSGGSTLSNILSAGLGTSANEDAADELLKAQRESMALYEPYLNQEFTPGDLTQDPGYQFQLAEGEKALARQQAARGNYFSGSALKAAQDYGQGLADSTYNEAFQRNRAQNADNLTAAQLASGVYGNQGNIKANAGISNSNLLSSALSGILGGSGAIGNEGQQLGRQLVGYNPQTGEPIYA